MRVLVAGATGAIGRQLVPVLVKAGHAVTGLMRSPRNAQWVRELGAKPIVCDALDVNAVAQAVTEAGPDTVVHELTALSGATDLRKLGKFFAISNELRTKGTDNLLAAAQRVGVRRFIAQSFCGWPYARTGAPVKSEGDPLDPNPPEELRATLHAIKYLEKEVISAAPIEGVVLRYGIFYGENTGIFDGGFLEQIRRRRVPLIGHGTAWWSFINTADAAEATALAVERGQPGIYNIVDDDPAQVAEWLPALAAMAGAKAPIHVPSFIARYLAGEHLVVMMTESCAGSNAKAKRELGWNPSHPSWRQGFAEIIQRGARLAA
jgi:nucleoside-diphosphate-sugar epimerase